MIAGSLDLWRKADKVGIVVEVTQRSRYSATFQSWSSLIAIKSFGISVMQALMSIIVQMSARRTRELGGKYRITHLCALRRPCQNSDLDA